MPYWGQVHLLISSIMNITLQINGVISVYTYYVDYQKNLLEMGGIMLMRNMKEIY